MRFHSLQQWLSWQESLNPREIDLGLDRVADVLQRMGLQADFSCRVITVAGTNGKGSSVAMLESILCSAGYRVGCYTSPHLLRYNERIRIDGDMLDDDDLCRAFDAVDRARGEVPLTYFEFGTLAALHVFARAELDFAVLEVGLGGRLDAVNVVNADVALITTVDIDHTDWLGPDVETIAMEKAGIMRAGRTAIYGGEPCPQSVRRIAQERGAHLLCAGEDYRFQALDANSWSLCDGAQAALCLPRPALPGEFQLQNAAAVLMALRALPEAELDANAIHGGLRKVTLAGRFQYLRRRPDVIVDVAHNAQAAEALRRLLATHPVPGRTLAVIAMLRDKAIQEVVTVMQGEIDEWFCAGLDSSRGLNADGMAKIVKQVVSNVKLCSQSTVTEACNAALARARAEDRIIVFGSFLTAAEAWHTING